MAGWRQAVASAMTGEEIEALTALSRSRTEPAGRVSRAATLSAIGRSHRTLLWDEDLACIIRRSSAASSEPWPMARLRHSMTDRDRAKSRRSRRRPRPGRYLWPATRPRSTAIRMNCGRHGFWPPCARARTGGGSPMSRWSGSRHRVQLLGQRKSAVQGALLSETPRRRVRAQDGGVLCVHREVQVLKEPLPRRRNRTSRSRSFLTTRSLESRLSP